MEKEKFFGDDIFVDISSFVNELDDENLSEFAKQFLVSLVLKYDQDNKNWFFSATRDIYEFIQDFTMPNAKIRVFNTSIDDKVWENNYTIIEILNIDKPFIVDSATEEIKSLGFTIEQRINVVIATQRDEQGKLIKILPDDKKHTSRNKESVILFAVSKLDDKEIDTLASNLTQISEIVRVTVEDWHPMLNAVDESVIAIKSSAKLLESNTNEFEVFLEWLKKGNFVFLGYAEYLIQDGELIRNLDSQLGIYKVTEVANESSVFIEEKDSLMYITRSDNVSRVHRRANMDCVRIKEFDKNKKIVKERRFLGLFTSIVYYQDVQLIPVIRKKIEVVEKMSKFVRGGHNNKVLISVLQTFPRSELLHVPEEELFRTCIGMIALSIKPTFKLFVHRDKVGLFLRCMLFIPNEQFSISLWEKIQKFIIAKFNAKLINENVVINETNLVRLQVILKLQNADDNVSDADLEKSVLLMVQSWDDNLKTTIKANLTHKIAQKICQKYIGKFPESYKEFFNHEMAFEDILIIENILSGKLLDVKLYKEADLYNLKIYVTNNKSDLFNILPVIDNMAMKVIDHYNYRLNIFDEGSIHIHRFILQISEKTYLEISDIKEQFQEALIKILNKEIENDYYNSLILLAGLRWNEVLLLRAIGNYLKQLTFNYSQDYIQSVLSKHPELMLCLVKLFNAKFNHEVVESDENKETIALLVTKIERILSGVQNLIDDKIVRSFFEVINAIVRTNYYLKKQYISFKIDSSLISFLPLPKPFMEIYVYSNLFEGIHLRGGKVSRGGIRWSNRTEDFRTEILSLFKSQMPKNTAIVPVGAKGGFIIKESIEDKKAYMALVLNCYKDFLRGLLDITDNIVDGVCKHPSHIVVYDSEDPYLVVAADKGTATFSNYANDVSQEYGFWLLDAFASGGSSGYDHKKMAITSRGAWITLEIRLWEKFNDMHKSPLTVVGIGDMSGDLFGNGMIASDNLKLLAAFNNLYIFVDPDPDPKISFTERKRLFELEQSNWVDYDKELISQGGGIFLRNSKSIDITPQMKDVFGITENVLNTNEFLKAILKAPVHFIWNGGIGTFVKSEKESNDSVGDKSNDSIRINGNQVRAAIIVEGGNVGCTQLGRIEYVKHGGIINTDFIDNCAGVACSDMEVNIKIAFATAMRSGKVNLEERNKILESMKNEVADIILTKTNKMQAKALTAESTLSVENLECYQRLLYVLEKSGRLNREMEFLPSNEEIASMLAEKRSFERPSIAVLIAYSKMYLYDKILHSDLPDLSYLDKYLVGYFPTLMQKRFHEEIINHPLKREMISTIVVNLVINRMGCTFINNAVENSGLNEEDVVKILIAIFEAYKMSSIYETFDTLYGNIDISLYLQVNIAISRCISNTAYWFFRNYPRSINISLIVDEFYDDVDMLLQNLEEVFDDEICVQYTKYVEQLKNSGLPEDLSVQLAKLEFMKDISAIIQVNHSLRFNDKIAITTLITGKIYFEIGKDLGLNWVYDVISDKLKTSSYWERLSIKVLSGEIYDYQVSATDEVAKYLDDVEEDYISAIAKWKEANRVKLVQYESFLGDIKASGNIDITKLVMISKRLSAVVAS